MEKQLLVVLSCLAVAWTHPEGVPLEYQNICQTMLPSHNGSAPKTDAAPFNISFNATCYDATLPINVTILATQRTPQFIGFFVEARKPGINSFSYGTFGNNGDHQIKALSCFNKEASAVCQYNPGVKARSVRHAGHDHTKWASKTFTWAPPKDTTDDLEFVATVLEGFDEFWVGIKSKTVRSCPYSKSSTVHPSTLLAALVATGALWLHVLPTSIAV